MNSEFHILLVDDSPTDVKIIQRALRESSVAHRLTVIPDGRKALDYLSRMTEPDASEDLEPDLILLDLNLPGIDGSQVLGQIKADPYLRAFPVVVLTTSCRQEDVIHVYQTGANTYIQKPSEYPHYRDLVKTLKQYWDETALRPPRNRPRP